MERSLRHAAGVLGAALVVTVSGTVPASAQTVTRDDPRGDAPSGIDVTAARYGHTDDEVTVVARIPALGRVGTAALSISRFEIFEAGYVVQIRSRRASPPRTRLFFFDHFNLVPRRCDDVTGAWRDHGIRLSVARSCLEGHATRQVFAQFGIQRGGHVDRAPAVKRLRRS